jgi:Na+-driven multidrug efflux pump
MNYVMLVFLILSILAFIFAEPITGLRTGKEFSLEQIAIAVKLTRLMLFAQLFFAIPIF